jgi:hypothetical protein
MRNGDKRMFKKGNSHGVKGKPSGTRDRPKRMDALRALRRAEFNPFEALIRVGREAEKSGDLKTAIVAYKELCAYVAPKLKSVEVEIKPEVINVVSHIPLNNEEWTDKYGGLGDKK